MAKFPQLFANYSSVFMDMFKNKELSFYFWKNKAQDNDNLDEIINKSIENPENDKFLFKDFQWSGSILFNSKKITNLVSKLIENDLSFNTIFNEKNIQYELTYDKFTKLSINAQKFFTGKMLRSILFKQGEINQFKYDHLRNYDLCSYYLFTLHVFNKHKDDEVMFKELSELFFNSFNIDVININFLLLNFFDKIIYPEENKFFPKILSPEISNHLIDLSINQKNFSILEKISSFDHNTQDKFYSNYFENQNSSDVLKNVRISQLPFIPKYIRVKFSEKMSFNLDDFPLLEGSSLSVHTENYNINSTINIDSLIFNEIYSSYFTISKLSQILKKIQVSYNGLDISLTPEFQNKNSFKIILNINYNIENEALAKEMFSQKIDIVNFIISKYCTEYLKIDLYEFDNRKKNLLITELNDSILFNSLQELRQKKLFNILETDNSTISKKRKI